MHQRMLRSSLLMCTKIRVFSESASRCTGRPYRGHQRKADIFGPDDRQGWYIVWRNCEYRAAMHRLFSFNHCIMPYISHFTIQFVLQSDKICLLNQCGGTDSLSLAVYPTTCISFLWHNCQRHLTVPTTMPDAVFSSSFGHHPLIQHVCTINGFHFTIQTPPCRIRARQNILLSPWLPSKDRNLRTCRRWL